MPPGAVPIPAPAGPGSGDYAPPAIPPGAVPAAPSAHTSDDPTRSPSMSYAQYDPATGRYVTADGRTYRQADLAGSGAARTWQDLFPT